MELVHDGGLTFEAASRRAENRYQTPQEEFRKMVDSYTPDDDSDLMEG